VKYHHMQEPGILWVWELQQTTKAFWHRERESCYSLHSNIQSLKLEMRKSKSISQSNKKHHSPGHFPITQAGDSSTSCPGKVSIGVMKLTATQISCTFSLSSFPLSHSITPKHHSESIFSFMWLSTPFLCLLKAHVTLLCMMWFSTVNIVLGPF